MTALRRGLATLALTASALPVAAQADDVRMHLEFVADRYFETPDGRGLLPTALAEADIALEYARLAAADSTSIAAIRRYATYVLHAVDPALVQSGPGYGYGVRAAASGVLREMGYALAIDSLSDNIRLHARYVVSAMENVVRWIDEVAVLANETVSAPTLSQATAAAGRLLQTTEAMTRGVDGKGDGRRGWPDGAEGIEQAAYHLTLMKRGEGWSGP